MCIRDRVTKPGLSCPVGNYAINPVPRQMIFQSVAHVLEETEAHGDYLIQLWIPAGRELALKTFNPKLGIEGGISILGTTGIVNPMSEQALMDTIRLLRKEYQVTILLIEHDMKLVSGICEELTVLNFGQELAQGETSAVLNDPKVITAYLGE